MWIDTDTYIGPCRRGAGAKFRLLNRRRASVADRDPSLDSLLRQLRSNAIDLSTAQSRRRFKLLLTATIDVARRTRRTACAAELTRLDAAMTERALTGPGAATAIERSLVAATMTTR